MGQRSGPPGKAGVPDTISVATKTTIALGQLRQALAAGVPVGIVLGDPAYGDETDFRVGVAEMGLRYMLGVRAGTSVWAPGTGADWTPGSWGGHRVMCGKYDGNVRTVRTWGVDVVVHPEFWAAYVVSVDATISHEWLTTTGLTPLGLDYDALRADMTYIQLATN